MKDKIIKGLLYLLGLILIIVIFIVLLNQNKKDKLNISAKYHSNSNISQQLIQVIENGASKAKHFLSDTSRIVDRYYFIIKFNNKNDNISFTFWVQANFPTSHFTDEGVVLTDMNNISYFNIQNKNVIIMDYPESIGYNLYLKNKASNANALLKNTKDSLICSKYGPILSNNLSDYYSYQILDSNLISISALLPTKYESENKIIIANEEIGLDSML